MIKNLKNLKKVVLQTALATFITVFAIAAIVSASTTIGSDITTGGTLTVTGVSTLNGNVILGDASADTITMNGVVGATSFSNTVTINGAKGLVLGSSTDAISGLEGMIYYDSTNSVIKMHDGDTWYTIGSTTSGILLSGGKLQLSDLATQYMTIGTTTQQGFSILTLEATTTTAIPLTIVADTSQSANLLQIMNDASSNLFYVASGGALHASSTLEVTGATTLYNNLTITPGYGIDTVTAGVLNFGTSTANQVIIGNTGATTTIGGNLSIPGGYTFDVGSTGALYIGTSTASSIIIGSSAATTTVANKLAVASTTPTAHFTVDAGGTATTTIDLEKVCFKFTDAAGNTLYYTPCVVNGDCPGTGAAWATSTTSCY